MINKTVLNKYDLTFFLIVFNIFILVNSEYTVAYRVVTTSTFQMLVYVCLFSFGNRTYYAKTG